MPNHFLARKFKYLLISTVLGVKIEKSFYFFVSDGDFETTLPIRNGHGRGWTSKSKEDDLAELKHYETMQDIVEGKADHLITKLSFEPGQLNLFQGRQCLHRVTPCLGTKDRMVAVLNYSPFPGMRKSKEVQEMFWGRSSDL